MTNGSDLTSEILSELVRRPGDIVTCRWLGGDRYRCNWWAQERPQKKEQAVATWLEIATHRIRQSQFLKVRKAGQNGRLSIEVMPA
jgi:hypothetical protein